MKKIDKKAFEEIRGWMHRNARQLPLSRWAFHFEGGSADAVVEALAFYQNADGGFGHAVEPDLWNPNSTPYATSYALRVLQETGQTDPTLPLLQGIYAYLDATADEKGWLFSIPSNDQYPRAPWWSFSEKTNQEESQGLSLSIVAFVLRYADRKFPLWEKSKKIAQSALDSFNGEGEMGLGGYALLLENVLAAGLEGEVDVLPLCEKLPPLSNAQIERNPDKWAEYTPRPSRFIPVPQSPLYAGNEEIVATELDYLVDTRHADGVWDINWSWFNLLEQYAREFAISENWWQAETCIDKLLFLRAFGRVEA